MIQEVVGRNLTGLVNLIHGYSMATLALGSLGVKIRAQRTYSVERTQKRGSDPLVHTAPCISDSLNSMLLSRKV